MSKDKGYNIDTDVQKKGNKGQYGIDIQLTQQQMGGNTLVKLAMLGIIASADVSFSPQNTHVRGDWKIGDQYVTENFPVVTLRVGNVDITEKVYGRQIGGNMRGHYVTYAFSAHVWAEKSYQMFDEDMDDTKSQSQPASDLTDEIINVLEQYTGDAASGICWFHQVLARESEPERGPQRLTRFIITGFVIAKRPLT
jgi:hypothetical protein